MRITRAMLLGVLLFAGCGGGGEGASIRLYHLEAQVQGPLADGDVTCSTSALVCPYVIHERTVPTYDLEGEPALTEDEFETERAQALVTDVSGQPAVTLDLTEDGRAKFRTLTRELARIGRERGAPQHIAFVVDDELVAWPQLDYEEFPEGLTGDTGVQISVDTLGDAQRLQRAIRGED